jgi:hypothetical protein
MIHSIAQWWQRFQIESQCRYTSRMMKRLGYFEQYVAEYFRIHPAPPSIEELSGRFLWSLRDHEDPVLRAVAQLELTCIQVSDERARGAIIYWDRNPNEVMDALDRFEPLPTREPGVRYILRMGPDLPDGVSCVREAIRS